MRCLIPIQVLLMICAVSACAAAPPIAGDCARMATVLKRSMLR